MFSDIVESYWSDNNILTNNNQRVCDGFGIWYNTLNRPTEELNSIKTSDTNWRLFDQNYPFPCNKCKCQLEKNLIEII